MFGNQREAFTEDIVSLGLQGVVLGLAFGQVLLEVFQSFFFLIILHSPLLVLGQNLNVGIRLADLTSKVGDLSMNLVLLLGK